ncbi:MAG TPA: hypothetical protein VGN46_11605 [Luteibacter sp.]|jgi:hypothetical protein|uniref:hypothetical protein n=1 Tax=Luteibacter sp. TaxID=1886636 RepID=UPI002F40A1D8
MEFERARDILQRAERLVARERPPSRPESRWTLFVDTLFGGPGLVGAGVRILGRRLGLTLLVAAVMFTYFCVMDHARWAQSFLPAICFAAAVVYFGLPSRTVSAGVTAQNIDKLADAMVQSVQSADELERLGAGLAIFRTQKLDRLSRFSVLAGIGWAVLFWYVTSHVLAPGLATAVVGTGVLYTGMAAIVFLIVLGLASAHATAVRAVHQTVEFALLEAKRLQASVVRALPTGPADAVESFLAL